MLSRLVRWTVSLALVAALCGLSVAASQEQSSLEFKVYFWADSADPRMGQDTINEVAKLVAGMPGSTVTVTGHDDRMKPAWESLRLSEERAMAVTEALLRAGTPASAIRVSWVGETDPAFATTDGVREPLNRRVVIRVQFPALQARQTPRSTYVPPAPARPSPPPATAPATAILGGGTSSSLCRSTTAIVSNPEKYFTGAVQPLKAYSGAPAGRKVTLFNGSCELESRGPEYTLHCSRESVVHEEDFYDVAAMRAAAVFAEDLRRCFRLPGPVSTKISKPTYNRLGIGRTNVVFDTSYGGVRVLVYGFFSSGYNGSGRISREPMTSKYFRSKYDISVIWRR